MSERRPQALDTSHTLLVDARQGLGSDGQPTSHRADGPATVASPDQPDRPWWRTALDYHRSVLLAVVVTIAYASIGIRFIQRDEALVGLACLVLATGTAVSLIGWLRPAHPLRRWSAGLCLLLVAVPFVWVYVHH